MSFCTYVVHIFSVRANDIKMTSFKNVSNDRVCTYLCILNSLPLRKKCNFMLQARLAWVALLLEGPKQFYFSMQLALFEDELG